MKLKSKFLSLILVAAMAVGCEDILEVTPRQSIDSGIALESPAAVTAALNSVYAYLQNVSQYGRDLIAAPEVLADNTFNTGNGSLTSEFLNQPGAHINIWQSSYYAINEINNILAALETLDADKEFKDGIAGQAHFLRALYYHNLMRVYAYDPTAIIEEVNRGGVPLMLDPVLGIDDITTKSRAPINVIYDQIYSDLDMAYQLLQGTNAGNAPEYATSGAAAALFTRVALYNGDYPKVISEAQKALESGVGSFQSTSSYVAAWREELHPESFFSVIFLGPDNVGVNNSLRATFTSRISLNSSTYRSRGNVVLSDDLYSLYDDADVRKDLIMNGLGRNNGLKEISKFLSRSGVANLDNVPVIRVSEVILNRAEAYARSNQYNLARTDLNTIRERAGLDPIEDLSGQALIDEILLQRRLELAFEGHRFFDLKRLGLDIQKETETVFFDEYRILAPIPIRELEYNPELDPNEGY